MTYNVFGGTLNPTLLLTGDCRYYVDYKNTDRKFKFQVDETTGVVKIRNEFDADVERTFNLHILAVDQGNMLFRNDAVSLSAFS